MDVAATNGEARSSEAEQWRWLYWLSVVLFLSAAAMPYVVAWLWERDLIVRDRPWEYYKLENVYLRLFLLAIFLLTSYKVVAKKYIYLIFFLLSIFLMEVKRNSTNDLDHKEIFTVMGVGIVYISFLLSFIGGLFYVKMPWKWLVYSWRVFLVILLMGAYLFFGGYVFSPVRGWYYFPGSGYLSTYDNLKRYRYEFLYMLKIGIKRNIEEFKEIPEGFLPEDFLCRVEKLYDNMIKCARLKPSCFFKERHYIQKEGNVELDVYFTKPPEVFGPYAMISYRGKRVDHGYFDGYFPSRRLHEYEDKYITYCKKGEGEGKEETDHGLRNPLSGNSDMGCSGIPAFPLDVGLCVDGPSLVDLDKHGADETQQ